MDSAGNIFGTTSSGGTYGEGTIYKIEPNGTETVLHSFGPQANGMWPKFGLTQDSAGNLYGITQYVDLVHDSAGNLYGTVYTGGAYSNGGVVFELSLP